MTCIPATLTPEFYHEKLSIRRFRYTAVLKRIPGTGLTMTCGHLGGHPTYQLLWKPAYTTLWPMGRPFKSSSYFSKHSLVLLLKKNTKHCQPLGKTLIRD